MFEAFHLAFKSFPARLLHTDRRGAATAISPPRTRWGREVGQRARVLWQGPRRRAGAGLMGPSAAGLPPPQARARLEDGAGPLEEGVSRGGGERGLRGGLHPVGFRGLLQPCEVHSQGNNQGLVALAGVGLSGVFGPQAWTPLARVATAPCEGRWDAPKERDGWSAPCRPRDWDPPPVGPRWGRGASSAPRTRVSLSAGYTVRVGVAKAWGSSDFWGEQVSPLCRFQRSCSLHVSHPLVCADGGPPSALNSARKEVGRSEPAEFPFTQVPCAVGQVPSTRPPGRTALLGSL